MSTTKIDASALVWRKARASYSNGQCVEVARLSPDGGAGPDVAIRDSVAPRGPVQRYRRTAWRSFLESAKLGELG
jgi:hypothetical protein